MSQLLQDSANLATIFAFLWAIYEFAWKRRTIANANVTIPPHFGKEELPIEIEIYNKSADKPIGIKSICIEAKRLNSYAVCEEIEPITIEPFGYKKFRHDIARMLANIANKVKGRNINIYFITTSGAQIEAKMDEFYKQDLHEFLKRMANANP